MVEDWVEGSPVSQDSGADLLEEPIRHLRVNLKSDGCYFMVLLGILTVKPFRIIMLRYSVTVRFHNSE